VEAARDHRVGVGCRRGVDPVNGSRAIARLALLLALVVVVAAAVLSCGEARAASIRIPESSALHRLALEREAASRFGLDAPVALIAAQIHQESRWRPTARSKYAEGLAQFTPPTARWLPQVCPEIGPPDPWDAAWSLRAIVCYDHYLFARANYAATDCDRGAFALSAYNGGEVMLRRERKLAAESGADASRWFDQVERFRARAQWAWDENRGYVRRILRELEPVYLSAGWPGSATC
jgi:soluble lytic murein transglycosylase-like protein